MTRQAKKQASSTTQSAELSARLKALHRATLGMSKGEQLPFVRETAGLIFDQVYGGGDALEIEVQQAKAEMNELKQQLEFEKSVLADIEEFLPKPANGGNDDDDIND